MPRPPTARSPTATSPTARSKDDARAENVRAIAAADLVAVQGIGLRMPPCARARAKLGVLGWVRNGEDGTVALHAEGPPAAIDALIAFLHRGPRAAAVQEVLVDEVRSEGHEHVRDPRHQRRRLRRAGACGEHTDHFDLRLEVAGRMRSCGGCRRARSLDPSVKRLAVEVPSTSRSDNDFEGHDRPWWRAGVGPRPLRAGRQGPVAAGDRPWPRGVRLHGRKLRGGFALQRTRPVPKAQWLLIKPRRDEQARAGSDVVGEQPASVLSGRTLADVVGERADEA